MGTTLPVPLKLTVSAIAGVESMATVTAATRRACIRMSIILRALLLTLCAPATTAVMCGPAVEDARSHAS